MSDPRKFAVKLAQSLKQSETAPKTTSTLKTYLAGDAPPRPPIQRSAPAKQSKPAKL